MKTLVREVVLNAVRELTKGDKSRIFSPNELKPIIQKTHPDFNMKNLHPEIHAYCPNSPSRQHYHTSSNRIYYWKVGKGKYRLFDELTDK
ncbi:MAG: hypothetical protein OXD01_03915 [Gammaproteobacteria bacterium]|nr:hypothetical protein [Gammaproteobacteria bacterium]